METTEVRQVVERLTGPVWAFATLEYAVETGMLEHLNEPRTTVYISERTGVNPVLVERIFDVLASLNLVERQGEMFTADKGLIPLVSPPAKNYFLANLRTSHFQSHHFVETAQKPTSSIGWNFTEPSILQSMGLFSAAGMDSSFKQMMSLDGLAARLESSSARVLDIGVGVAALSIALCRALLNLHVVGIDPLDAALVEARRNIAAAGLADRIELRKQGIEDLTDKEAFDYAFFPQQFMPDDVVRRGLTNVWRALRPGGWVTVTTTCILGTDLQATLSRLHDTLLGGCAHVAPQIEAIMTDAGFTSIRISEVPGMATIRGISGRRPA